MTNIYLCDIDGTLSDHQGIRSPYDEDKVHLDIPLPTCELIETLQYTHKVIFFSGRTEKCREASTKWIQDNTHCHNITLYMRQIGDNRPDEIIKEELYNTYIKDKYRVLGVFDDRLKVCRIWYRIGLFVFNCNQGLKEF